MELNNRGREFSQVGKEIAKKKSFYLFGAGTFGNYFVEAIKSEIVIAGYLDNSKDKKGKIFNGFSCYLFEEVILREDQGIIITVSRHTRTQIIEQLNKCGYVKNQNYFMMEDFWSIYYAYTYDNVMLNLGGYDVSQRQAEYVLKKKKEDKPVTMLMRWYGKRITPLNTFYEMYKQTHPLEDCIEFSLSWQGIYCKAAENEICFPDVFMWNGHDVPVDVEEEIRKSDWNQYLDDNEREYVKWIEETLYSENQDTAINISAYNYVKLKEIVEMINPKKIIMWTDNQRGCYVLTDIAKKKNIQYKYLEFGWLPGTLQVDGRGIGGRSEYVTGKSKLKEISQEEIESYNIPEILNNIVENKRDTGIFRESKRDEEVLSMLDKKKKCIFFPSFGDKNPVFNNMSSLWETEISSLFKSSKAALLYLADICKKNDWQLLYKPHPGCASDYDHDLCGYEDVIFQVQDMEIDKILQRVDLVTCFYSAIEFKTLMYNKPLVKLGYSLLSIADCAYIPKEKVELENCIKIALEDGYTLNQKNNFYKLLGQLLENCLWDDYTIRDLRYGLDIKERDIWEKEKC